MFGPIAVRGRAASAVARSSRCLQLAPRVVAHDTPLHRNRTAHRLQSTSTPAAPVLNVVKPPRFGQPHASTHPHILQSSELTSGMPLSEYEDRRKRLMESLPSGSVVICMSGTVKLVTQQIFYKFRQATDFYYLTGFAEPDSVLVLESKPSSPKGYITTLYVPPKDSHDELWEGARTGTNGVMQYFGADRAYTTDSFSLHLPDLLSSNDLIYASLPPATSPSIWSAAYPPPSSSVASGRSKRKTALSKLFASPSSVWTSPTEPPHLLLHAALLGGKAKPLSFEVEKMRIVKSPRELALMKKAADISSAAHTRVMRFSEQGKSESQLAAVFEYHCAMEGSERPAYVPVVASGANSLVIHYINNTCQLQDGELVLIDAGCEYGQYASDITRTFPVSGKFTEPQRDLYQAVLNVQKECIKRCKVEDEVGMNELHRFSCSMLTEELRQIGFKLTTGEVERKLYPHALSHHLGSDLHDCPSWTRNSTLIEGNVITIEPGVYVPLDDSFPKHFHGIGIRIEDAVAFTKDGPLVMSANAPKEVVDVEGACQGALEE